mgnify:CR=1 FL=1
MYPKVILKLIEDFQQLPGIGEKTAERLALHVVTKMPKDVIETFSKDLKDSIEDLKSCQSCHMITDQDICPICLDSSRENTIMVVAEAKDVISLEKMNTYHGYYHVLGGLIDFSRGITDDELNIDSLSQRLKKYDELIIATNSTVEGELTATYIKTLYEDQPLDISRLAYGLPVGTDFKYADAQTLAKAVENRKKY